MTNVRQLTEFVHVNAERSGVPGAAVGLWADGKELFACHGVTSVENPVAIDPHTLFILGSVTKTYTATALMRLVHQGVVDLNAPVRLYVPELALADAKAAEEITVLHLLNHTSGLDWRIDVDTGEGDDALAREIHAMQKCTLIAAPGTRFSYSQAGYDLLGRLIERCTGTTYERAMDTLVFSPLGLTESFFSRDDIMTRRFAVGHKAEGGRVPTIARPWRHWRSDNPGGGLVSSAYDQIGWARFHLTESRADHGKILPFTALHQMRVPTVSLKSSSLGDALGIGWFLREIGGLRAFGHDGSANGQFANLLVVPDAHFAIVALSNIGPDAGMAFNRAVLSWALEQFAGIVESKIQCEPYDPLRAKFVVGSYENEMMVLHIADDGQSLTIECKIKPEIRAVAANQPPPDLPPASFGFVPGADGGFLVTSGGLEGQRGHFTLSESGRAKGLDLAGRYFEKIDPAGGRIA